MKNTKILLLTVVTTTLPFLLLVNPGRAVTVDFSSIADCPASCPVFINASTFAAQGVVFTVGNEISLIQGDEAVLDGAGSSVAGYFTTPMVLSNLSVQVAPSVQGTKLFTLSAFDTGLTVVGSVSLQVTQDFGDPENTGFGYVTLLVDQFSGPVSSFAITSTYIRSSFNNQSAGFGMATLTFDVIPDATPLPATLPLFATGLGVLGLIGWRRKRKQAA